MNRMRQNFICLQRMAKKKGYIKEKNAGVEAVDLITLEKEGEDKEEMENIETGMQS